MRSRRTRVALIKLVDLRAWSRSLLTGVLAQTIGTLAFGGTTSYKACSPTSPACSPATTSGSPASGSAGQQASRSSRATQAEVTLHRCRATSPLAHRRRPAQIRYRNLVGQRYVALTRAPASGGAALPPGGTHPASSADRRPALDLTVLFNGFRPLFTALTPEDVNKLSLEIIQVLQGEGGTIDSLLAHTASLTNDARRPGRRHRPGDRPTSTPCWPRVDAARRAAGPS